MFTRHTSLILSLTMWIFGFAAANAQSSDGSVETLKGKELVNYAVSTGGVFSFTSQRTTSKSMTDPADHKVLSKTTNKNDPSQWWLLQPLGNGRVALRNYATGRYMKNTSGTSVRYTTVEDRQTLYAKTSVTATSTKAFITISSNENFSGNSCLHDDNNNYVVNWAASTTAGANPASDWRVVPIADLDAATVKEHFAELSGYAVPADGVTVRIRNVETGTQITEFGNGQLLATEPSDEDYSQCWVMESTGDGQYAFRNVQTGHYFSYTSGTGNGSIQTASATKKSSYILTETSDLWERTYHISATTAPSRFFTHTTAGKAPTDTPQPYVVNTDADGARTHWVLIKANLDLNAIEEAQLAYKSYEDIKGNASGYTAKMAEYFTDNSFSDLKPAYSAMSSEELRAKLEADRLPEYLIRIALKVKNDTWSDEDTMSRDFRVADYQVYTHYIFSKDKMGMGCGFGRLSNPTGVVVKAGDIVTVFADKSAPQGSELQLEVVQGTDASGTTYTLNKGINIFNFAEEATLYIFYQIKDSKVNTPLASCPDVRIHIEGGHLNGYYDKTRGHDDTTWKHLRTHLLKHSNVINIKTPHLVFCLNSQMTQQACPTYMERLLKAWDSMVESENELMGYDDEHHPGLSSVQRNVYNFFSKDYYIGGWMMASINGVSVMESAIPSIMNPSDMENEGIWGPAHECGHLRQYLIQMLGTLESSNNLFSNVAVYKQGRTTQRSADPQAITDKFAAKKAWVDYEGGEMTRMLYQLYLYFHVNEVMPDFYPQLFLKMQSDPMKRNTEVGTTTGGNDYLKLARACCDVAQADLSEFFAAYGFFVPVGSKTIYENGNWVISTSQAEIDAALEYMHKYPKKYGNLLFIEDRVLPVLATYEGHKQGETKKRRSDDGLAASSKAGDVGQYSTYLEEPSLVDYYYTITTSGKVTVNGTGATGLVGFKVYDDAGKLAYFSNRLSFTLPAALRDKDYTLVAAMGDGSDVVLTTDLPVSVGHISTAQPAASALYDMQGRVFSGHPSNGRVVRPGSLYIQGGKKHLFK